MLQVWGTGKVGDRREDVLYNTEVMVPPRPTISNVQWLTGTNYVSPTDFDVLIGGADRPPSKRMLAAAAAEKQLQAQQNRPQPNRQASGASSSAAGGSQEGWGDYMTRQIQERTEKLGLMGDSVEDTAGNSKGWSDQASDMVRKQKRGLLMKAVTKGFF